MDEIQIDPLQRLTKDIKAAAATLSAGEVRFLVDYYYQMQADRIRSNHQVRTLVESGEPHQVLAWLGVNTETLERNIKSALDVYTSGHQVGRWSKSIVGIGPILAAGLLAHIDIEKAPTVGHIWRFAGLDPTVTWEKKSKRPWNASLKTLTWKIGESFVKVSGHAEDVYGKLYLHRKAIEQARNESGALAAQAAAALVARKFGAETEARKHYEAGHLPPAHIHARAKRWAVKLFLAHWHEVAYRVRYGTEPPKPYVLEHLGHVDRLVVPNWPMS